MSDKSLYLLVFIGFKRQTLSDIFVKTVRYYKKVKSLSDKCQTNRCSSRFLWDSSVRQMSDIFLQIATSKAENGYDKITMCSHCSSSCIGRSYLASSSLIYSGILSISSLNSMASFQRCYTSILKI